MIIKKKPVRELPVGYVPPGGVPFDVSGSSPRWNWASVAAHHKLADVWKDLIEFNFPTLAFESTFQDKCAAVNWYLEERVGCFRTVDGKNFIFEGATKKFIYVPKVVTDEIGVRAARSILRALESPEVQSLDFILDGVLIQPSFFHKVGKAILDGKIGIAVNPPGMAPGSIAEYDFSSSPPMFRLRQADMVSADQKATIIHESAHAISHLKGRDRLIRLDEAVAHLAAAIFHRKLTGTRITNGVAGSAKDDAHNAADDVAQLVLKRRPIGKAESTSIQNKIKALYPAGTYQYSKFPIT